MFTGELDKDENMSDLNEVPIRIYLNKQFQATSNFDKCNDIFVNIQLERDLDSNQYELEDICADVKSQFRRHKELKGTDIKEKLKNEKTYKFFGYELFTEIDNNEDLTNEIEAIFPPCGDNSNDNRNNIIKLRLIFQEPSSIIKLHPPELYQRRIARYFDKNIKQMAYYNLFEWNKPNVNEEEKTGIIWVYDIIETNTNRNDLNISIEQQLSYVIKPLDVNTKYIFQMKVYSKTDNNIYSIWSKPKIIYTPNMMEQNNNLLPKPKYLHVTS